MTVALIQTNPPAIMQVFSQDVVDINVPGKWQAQSVTAGYQTPDGVFSVVSIVPFVPTNGQMAIGIPTYTLLNGVVTQTYASAPIPAPIPFVTLSTLIQRLTGAEYVAIKKAIAAQIAANNGTVALWYDIAQSGQPINLNDAQTVTIKALLVSSGLLTQPRADAVFVV